MPTITKKLEPPTILEEYASLKEMETLIDVKNEYMSAIFGKWIWEIDQNRINAGISRKLISKNTKISIGRLEKGCIEGYQSFTLERFLVIVKFLEKHPEYKSPYPGFTSTDIEIWASDLDRRMKLNKITAVKLAKSLNVDNTSPKYWKSRNYICIKISKFIELLDFLEKESVDTRMFI